MPSAFNARRVGDGRFRQEVVRPLALLRGEGVKITVDDTGAGFSSLQYIVQLAPNVIKLDISLTQDMGVSPVRGALGGALIDFVHGTGAQLVVEGSSLKLT